MKVAKFGGSSLATAECIRQVFDIVVADADRRLIVVSAPGKRDEGDTKVTDLLIALADARLLGQAGEEELADVVGRYGDIASELGAGAAVVEEIEDDLRARQVPAPHQRRKGLALRAVHLPLAHLTTQRGAVL